MIRSFFFDFVFPFLIFLVLRPILRGFFSGYRGNAVNSRAYHPQQPPPPGGPTAELKQDPVCGAYVPTTTSLSRTVRGRLVYFCSAECRDKYVA